MQARNTSVRLAVVVLVSAGLGLSAAACGKYSLGNLKANKAFKDANDAYKKGEYKEASDKYEEVLQDNPDPQDALTATYFFLGNSYDNLYKPTRKGEPANDAYLQKAVDYYKLATERGTDVARRKLAYEYLIAAYGPDKLNQFDMAEPLAKKLIEIEPDEPVNYQALGKLYEDAKRIPDAEAQYKKAIDVKPNDPNSYEMLAGFYMRQNQFEKTMDALNQRAKREPNNPEAFHMMATYYWDRSFYDARYRITQAQKREYIDKGLAAEDQALALNPDYLEALTYKNILLRMKANIEPDSTKQKALIKEADTLRERVLDLQKKQKDAAAAAAAAGDKGRGGK